MTSDLDIHICVDMHLHIQRIQDSYSQEHGGITALSAQMVGQCDQEATES